MIIIAAKASELEILDEDVINDAEKIIITGVGGMNAVKKILQAVRPSKEDALNVGYVGSNSLKVGDRVQICSVLTHHPGVEFKEKPIQLDLINIEKDAFPCYTSTDFVTDTNIKGPAVFDMELAFIAGLNWHSLSAIKQVSDNLNLEQYERSTK